MAKYTYRFFGVKMEANGPVLGLFIIFVVLLFSVFSLFWGGIVWAVTGMSFGRSYVLGLGISMLVGALLECTNVGRK